MMMYRSHRRDQQIVNTPTLKPIVERYGWLNRLRDTRELNVKHQRIKHPINRLLVRHLREKTRTSYVDFSRPVFKMAVPPLTCNKIQQEYSITCAQNLSR